VSHMNVDDVDANKGLYESMGYTYVGNVSEKKQAICNLKNIGKEIQLWFY